MDNFDRRVRLTIRIYNYDRFDVAVRLEDRRSTVIVNDITTWGLVVDAENEARERELTDLQRLKNFVRM